MDKKVDDVVFVTIGVPFSSIPIMQKVMTYVDVKGGQTPVEAAKLLRKLVADNIENHGFVGGTNFLPSFLYYEIYGSADNNVPFVASLNARFWNQAV